MDFSNDFSNYFQLQTPLTKQSRLFGVGQRGYSGHRRSQSMQARITTIAFAVTCLSMMCMGQAHAAEKASPWKGCEVQVTGAVTTGWKGDWKNSDDDQSGNVGAASDYWLSDGDLRDFVEYYAGPRQNIGRKLVQLMRRVPRVAILLLNCMTPDGQVFIHPASKSEYDNVPRKSGTYKIAPEQTATPGQFVASSLKVGKTYYRVTGGRLDLKKFNFDGVNATFTLKATPVRAEGKDGEISVQGSFNIPCTGVGSRCKTQ
jgi:hypothetical protein